MELDRHMYKVCLQLTVSVVNSYDAAADAVWVILLRKVDWGTCFHRSMSKYSDIPFRLMETRLKQLEHLLIFEHQIQYRDLPTLR